MTVEICKDKQSQSRVEQVVSGIKNLPTPPIVFSQIQKVINKESSSAGDVAKILAEDPSMSAKVLKMTNSAFYGLSREIDSVKQAVMIIGFDAVKNLVLSASVMGMFSGSKIDPEFQERFWRHSLATALAGRLSAKTIRSRGMVDADTIFSAGLLHDIGKLVIGCFMEEEFFAIREILKGDESRDESSAELEVLGFSHEQIGGALAQFWNLSDGLVDAIAYHHAPEESQLESSMAYLVYVANFVANKSFASDLDVGRKDEMSPKVLAYLDITGETIEELSGGLISEYTHAETFMSMAGV